jgi:hypothetical protein
VYEKVNKKIRRKRFKKYLVSTGEMFCNGYTAAYAKYKSSFHQILYVNTYIIKILRGILNIVLAAFSAMGLLFIFQEIVLARPMIVALASIYITIQYQKIKFLYKTYQIMFEHEFGKEYNDKMIESVKQYWDSITKRQSKEDTGEDSDSERE